MGHDNVVSKIKIRQLEGKLEEALAKIEAFDTKFAAQNKGLAVDRITDDDNEFHAQNYIFYFRCNVSALKRQETIVINRIKFARSGKVFDLN